MEAKKERFNSFDSLKFIIIFIGSTIGHFWQFTPKQYDAVCETAWMSKIVDALTHFSFLHTHTLMELLFMMSGFQMYLAYHERIKDDKISFIDFFKKRFVRLYPPMIISTVVMSIALLAYRHYAQTEWCGVFFMPKAFMMSILGVQAWMSDTHVINGPLWFLSVLVLCLIVYYLVERIGARYKMGILALFIPIVMALGHFFDPSMFIWLHNDVCRGFFGFFLGAVFAALYRYFDKKKFAIVSIIFMILYLPLFFGFYDIVLADGVERGVMTSLMFYGPLIIVLACFPKLDAIIGVKPLVYMGKASFHLYCFNFPFYVLLQTMNIRFSLNINYDSFYTFWILIIIQIVMAIVLHILIDEKLCPKVSELINKKEN